MLGIHELPFGDVVEFGKERIAHHFRMHPGQVHAIGAMQRLLKDLGPPADEDLIVKPGHLDRPLERRRGESAVHAKRAIVRDDDDRAAGKRKIERLVGSAAHQQVMPHRQLLEVL